MNEEREVEEEVDPDELRQLKLESLLLDKERQREGKGEKLSSSVPVPATLCTHIQLLYTYAVQNWHWSRSCTP